MAEETETPARAARKVREGTVVSNKMDKTAVVAVVVARSARSLQQDGACERRSCTLTTKKTT